MRQPKYYKPRLFSRVFFLDMIVSNAENLPVLESAFCP